VPLRVAIAGQFQQGKSLVFNLLVGEVLSEVGVGLRTTVTAVEHPLGGEGFNCPYRWTVLDTPGINHDSGDSLLATELCKKADFVIWLAKDQAPSELDWEFMTAIYRHSVPFGIVLNLDSNAPEHSAGLAKNIWAKACSFFNPFPLSEMGVFILQPQRVDLSQIKNSQKLPERLLRISSEVRSESHPVSELIKSGFEELLCWFVHSEGMFSRRTDLLASHIAIRKECSAYQDRSKSRLVEISNLLKTII